MKKKNKLVLIEVPTEITFIIILKVVLWFDLVDLSLEIISR